MKYYIVSIFLMGNMLLTACSNTDKLNKEQNELTTKENTNHKKISIEDHRIIEKYKKISNELNAHNMEENNVESKELLPEVAQIKNREERERIQMSIYLANGMYQEAYNLNSQILSDYPFVSNQITQCELMKALKLEKKLIQSCYTTLASYILEDQKKLSRNDIEYPYGQWGYLSSMYQAGHKEYKQKMEQFIKSTKDETMKSRFKDSYDLVTQ